MSPILFGAQCHDMHLIQNIYSGAKSSPMRSPYLGDCRPAVPWDGPAPTTGVFELSNSVPITSYEGGKVPIFFSHPREIDMGQDETGPDFTT